MKTSVAKLSSTHVRSAICLAVIVVSLPAGRALAYINGLDVYSGDGTITWSTVKNAGYDFVFVKATEGVDFIDSKFTTNMSGASAAGMYVGTYHLARPDSKNLVPWTSYNGQPFAFDSPTQTNRDAWLDATSEAADYIDVIRPYYFQTGNTRFLPPVADIETSKIPNFGNDTLNDTFISNWVQVFSDAIYNAIGIRPIMYLSKSNANENWTPTIKAEHPLFWVAWYKQTGTTSPPTAADNPNWAPWSFWQWSNGRDAVAQANQIPGTSSSIFHDRDVFSGTLAQLDSLKVQLVPGDYSHNGVVDMADYVLWRKQMSYPTAQYNAYSIAFLGADGNSSDKVDAGDYAFWRARYGRTLSGAGAGSEVDPLGVPEPTAIALILTTAAARLLVRRERRAK